jgi:transposase
MTAGGATRDQMARRFEVSLGMVKKLLQQRRRTGNIAPMHHRSLRKPLILDSHRRQMHAVLAATPDLTLGKSAPASVWAAPSRPSIMSWWTWG